MMQEELQDARAVSDTGKIARLRQVLQTQHDGLMRGVTERFTQLDDAVACEATRQDLLADIRRQLNAVAYVQKLLSQL